jgi:hypothetical protein
LNVSVWIPLILPLIRSQVTAHVPVERARLMLTVLALRITKLLL